MRKRYAALLALVALPLLAFSVSADVEDIVPGCNACHGNDGVSQLPAVPTIAGMSALVLEQALYDYREGTRPCGGTPEAAALVMAMCATASGVAEEFIAGIAEHYAALPFVPAAQQTDPAKVAQGKAIHDRECEICHIDGGANPVEDTSILAGQHMAYLARALGEYAAGTRPQPPAMEVKTAALSEQDIEALVHFYASQR